MDQNTQNENENEKKITSKETLSMEEKGINAYAVHTENSIFHTWKANSAETQEMVVKAFKF